MAYTSSSVPVALARDLPLYTGSVADDVSVVAVTGNGSVARMPLPSIVSGFVKWQPEAPQYPEEYGEQGYVAVDGNGFYCYFDGWKKLPFYGAHWDDLTADVRFLRVDGRMTLTQEELSNARGTLGIGLATTYIAGLVKASGTGVGDGSVLVSQDGTITVPTATSQEYGSVKLDSLVDTASAASVAYVNAKVAGREREVYEIATPEVPGLVRSDEEGGVFVVNSGGGVSIRVADSTTAGDGKPGLVKLSRWQLNPPNGVDEEDTIGTAASVERVSRMIEDAVSAQAGVAATEGTLGSVMVPGDGCIRIITDTTPAADIPHYGEEGMQWKSGSIDVNPADGSKHGAVVVSNVISPAIGDRTDQPINCRKYYIVPTAKAVNDFIEDKLVDVVHVDGGQISRANLPVATTALPGIVAVGEGLSINSYNSMLSVRAAMPTSSETVRNIPGQTKGAVYVCCTEEEETTAGYPIVPTVAKVMELLEDGQGSGGGGGGGTSIVVERPWEEVAATVVGTGARVSWSPRKFFIVPDNVDSLDVVVSSSYEGFEESVLKWTPPSHIRDFADDGVTSGLKWDLTTSTEVTGRRTYIIRLSRISRLMVVAKVQSSFN